MCATSGREKKKSSSDDRWQENALTWPGVLQMCWISTPVILINRTENACLNLLDYMPTTHQSFQKLTQNPWQEDRKGPKGNKIFAYATAPNWQSRFILQPTHAHSSTFEMEKNGGHTNSRDSGDNLSQFELVEDGGFPSSIKTHHKDSHLFFANQALQQVAKYVPHGSKFNSAGLGFFCPAGVKVLWMWKVPLAGEATAPSKMSWSGQQNHWNRSQQSWDYRMKDLQASTCGSSNSINLPINPCSWQIG